MIESRLGPLLVGIALLGSTPVAAADKDDYSDLAKLIQELVVAKLPREYEDRSIWGQTVPIPPRLILPGRRVTVRIGDRDELPDGTWKRTKVWLDDPSRDVRIVVKDLRPLTDGKHRVSLDATVSFHAERERQRWMRGLQGLGAVYRADAVVTVALECDVGVSLDATTFPPEAVVTPEVVEAAAEVKEFKGTRAGRLLQIELDLGDELKEAVNRMLKDYQPAIKELTAQAVARALKDGKARVSAATLLKLASKAK